MRLTRVGFEELEKRMEKQLEYDAERIAGTDDFMDDLMAYSVSILKTRCLWDGFTQVGFTDEQAFRLTLEAVEKMGLL